MKNLLTLLTTMLLISSAFANDITFLFTSDKYDVYLDGSKVSNYQSRSNQVRLNNLSTGRHRLEVYKDKDGDKDHYDRNRPNNDWNRYNRNNKKDKLVFSTYLDVKSQRDYFVAIEKNGKVNIDERNTYGNRNREDRGRNSHRRGNDNYGNDGYDRNGGYNNGGYDRNDRNDNGGYDRNGNYGNDGYGNNYHRAISNYEFNQLIQSIQNAWIGKFSKAKNGINDNYFYTDQVKQIIQIFSSEKDRLELAKMSYPKIVDPARFRDLYSQFSYSGQRELDDFIRTGKY